MKLGVSHKILQVTLGLSIFVAMNLAFQNCTKTQFQVDPLAKSEALDKESVFDPRTGGDDGSTTGARDGGDDDKNRAGAEPGDDNDTTAVVKDPSTCQPEVKDPGSVRIGFSSFRCSNSHTLKQGGNLVSSQAVKMVIKDSAGVVVCELQGDFREQIINTRSLSFKPCPDLIPGNYLASIVSTAGVVIGSGIGFAIKADKSVTSCGQNLDILYDLNIEDGGHAIADAEALNPGMSTTETRSKCDSHNSPLIISMKSRARGIPLTSPLDGIQFDILGERAHPVAHAKKQISWLAADVQEYYFITLPNKEGQVLGIDELFGNNTQGPEGRYAKNGYAALAKYDDDKDGFITSHDVVFSKLRLWNDFNRDGVSQNNELFTLTEKKLIVVDLHFDRRYKEEDQYGNKTLMKSVVKTEDGSLHLLFDLWFKTLEITK